MGTDLHSKDSDAAEREGARTKCCERLWRALGWTALCVFVGGLLARAFPPADESDSGAGTENFPVSGPTVAGSKVQGHVTIGGSGYEQRDAKAGWIFGIAAVLLVLGITMHFLVGGTLHLLRKQPAVTDRWQPGQRSRLNEVQARFPRLQVSPPIDLEAFRKQEDAELNTYGWVDQKSNVVRIPIARAMELLLEKGFPVRSGTNEPRASSSAYEMILQHAPQGQEGGK